MAAAEPLISIIVLNHEKADYTEACLESVLTSTYPEVEIVAVDNGSSDRTPHVLEAAAAATEQRGYRFVRIDNDTNVGAIVGRNQAMERASGDYFVFIDNDVLVCDRDWLEKLRAALDADPQVAIVSPKLLFPWPPFDIEFAGAAVSPNGRIQYVGRGEPRDSHGDSRDVQCLISACIMFRRTLVDEIGMLDEVFSPVQFEDLDFCYRARRAGYRVRYEAGVEMYHYEHTTTDGSRDINFKLVTLRNYRTFQQRWRDMFSAEGGPPDEECEWQPLPKQTIADYNPLHP